MQIIAHKLTLQQFGLWVSTFVVLICLSSFNHNHTSGLYWVYFTDKACSQHLAENPETLLSQKAMKRRANQHIQIDNKDLPVCKDYIQQLESSGYKIIEISKWLNAAVIELPKNEKLHFDFIKKITPLNRYQIDSGAILNKSTFKNKSSYQKNKTIDYGATYPQLNMLNSHCLHYDNYWGEGIDIAVLDAGFKNADSVFAFQHIFEEERLLTTYDFVEKDYDVFDEKDSSHGTVVWSTMAGLLKGEYTGTAPQANYHLFKTEDISSETLVEEYNWIAAAERADSLGVDIINSSLGYSLFDDSLENHIYADMDGNTTPISIAADVAASKGILVVTSAGNSGTRAWTYITAPADADSVLSVGAVNADREKTIFSSFGPSSDGDIKPDVAALGDKTITVKPNNELGQSSGTSLSSPLIAGMAACLWQKFPDKNNMEIIDLIKRSGAQYNRPDTLLGYGIPDFCQAQLDVAKQTIDVPFIVSSNIFGDCIFVTVFNQNDESGVHQIQLFNINGQLLQHKKQTIENTPSQTFIFSDLKNLSKGIYFIYYTVNNNTYHSKIIKLSSN